MDQKDCKWVSFLRIHETVLVLEQVVAFYSPVWQICVECWVKTGQALWQRLDILKWMKYISSGPCGDCNPNILCRVQMFVMLKGGLWSSSISITCELVRNTNSGEFPGGPMVRTQCFHCQGPGSILIGKRRFRKQCGTVKKKKILGLHTRPLESEIWTVGPSHVCFCQPSRWFWLMLKF